MSVPTSYKPSPLSFGSPRASPFRRPESPASPSPLRNSTVAPASSLTPTTPPAKAMGPPFQRSNSPAPLKNDGDSWTPRGLVASIPTYRSPERSPTRESESKPQIGAVITPSRSADVNALSKLQPGQVRQLREGFQMLDRDSDGLVGREDVVDMLTQLGLPSSNADLVPYFPTSNVPTVTLPTFLTQISSLLASISPPGELISAFSAFDDDDSGQVDVVELREALLHTAPEPGESALTEREIDRIVSGFSGRRAFGKSSGMGMGMAKRGEVFKYQEFVNAVSGGGNSKEGKEEQE